MQIIQELPKNKPNFPFNHTKDVYNTPHVARYLSIVFSNNKFLSGLRLYLQRVFVHTWGGGAHHSFVQPCEVQNEVSCVH